MYGADCEFIWSDRWLLTRSNHGSAVVVSVLLELFKTDKSDVQACCNAASIRCIYGDKIKSCWQIPSDTRENKYTRYMGIDKYKKYVPLLDSGHLVLISSFRSSSFSSPSSCYFSNWPHHIFTGHLHPHSSMIFVFYYWFNNPIFPARATSVSLCPSTN